MPLKLNNVADARQAFAADRPRFETLGAIFPGVTHYMFPAVRGNMQIAMDALAMDAMPSLATDPNAGILALLTTYVDPEVYEILFAPNKAVEILSEVKKGDWLTDTAAFPVVEQTGEVSSYGDWNNNGRAGINANWPQFQAYNYQLIMEYGEREMARYGLAKLNYVSEIERAAATIFNKYQNLMYFFGVAGLQNYGLINNPYLSAPLTSATKAAGGTSWYTDGVITATANEIFKDIQDLFTSLVVQTAGLVDRETKMTLALSPQSEAAFTTTNAFAVNVSDLLKKNFPNLKVVSAVQYQELSASNPQGVAGGNFMQLIAESLEGQKTAYAAYNEKARTGTIVKDLSAFRQKMMAGGWGTIIRMPVAIASMIGI